VADQELLQAWRYGGSVPLAELHKTRPRSEIGSITFRAAQNQHH
jgi:hypothetical protein